MKNECIVSMENICKSFGDNPVLKNVNFQLKEGEVHALVGGNGAGKSTLMKIMNGVYRKDSGVVRVRGKEVEYQHIRDAWKYGIRMIFQELSLCPTLSVMENVFLTNEIKKCGLLNKKEMKRKTEEILRELHIEAKPDDVIADLPVGTCQLIEIAKALFSDATVLILDEPTASLTDRETKVLFQRVNELKKKGISFIYISHRMKEIFQIADRISVLRDGEMVSTADIQATTLNEIIAQITSGASGDLQYRPHEKPVDENPELFRMENLVIGDLVKGVSFSIKRGEVLGIAGLMGSGRTETAEAIFGIRKYHSAKFFMEGKEIQIHSIRDAVANGIALIPEDRRREGLVLPHTLEQNLCLTNLKKIKRRILSSNRKARKFSENCVKDFRVKTSGVNVPMVNLSGGNQQKIVIAKWLKTEPKLLIMDEPTAGVDIGAKGEVIEIVREYAAMGNGVLFISSEMSELLAVCDRIIVYCEGTLTNEYRRESITSEEILEYAIQQ